MTARDRYHYRAPSVRVARHSGPRRAPAGFYVVNQTFMHVTMAGSEIYCAGCDTRGRLPLPRAAGYGAAVEEFLERHRLCNVGAA